MAAESKAVIAWKQENERFRKNDDGLSIMELCPLLGLNLTQTKYRVKRMLAEGRCTMGIAWRVNSLGAPYKVLVYKISDGEGKK